MSTRKRADQCRFCSSCRCFYRIVAVSFDELACREHVAELERFADAELPPGWPRNNVSSTSRMTRNRPERLAPYRHDGPVTIPTREAVTVTPPLTRRERDVLRHCLGIESISGRDTFGGGRNHFAADGEDVATWEGLVARGLAMRSRRALNDVHPYPVFHATRAGAVLVGAQLAPFKGAP